MRPTRVVGLELGADDYVTKPFSPRELLREFVPSSAVTMQWSHCRVAMKGCAPIVSPAEELNVRLHRLTSPTGDTFRS